MTPSPNIVISSDKYCMSSNSVSVSYREKQFLQARKQKEEAEEQIRAMRKNKLFRRIQADLKERDKKRKPGRGKRDYSGIPL